MAKPRAQGASGPQRGQKPANRGGTGAGRIAPVKVRKRTVRRLRAVGPVQGVSRKGGITRREAKKVKREWISEGRPGPKGKGGKPGKRGARGRRGMAGGPWDINAPYTPKRFKREVQAGVNMRYGPELRALQGEIGGSQYRANQEIPAWFGQFMQEAKHTQERTAAMYQGAQQNVLAASQQANQASLGALGGAQAQAQQEAAMRNQALNTAPFVQGQQAAASNLQQGIGQAGQLGAIGAGAQQDLAGQQMIGAVGQLQARADENRQLGNLQSERRGVLRERGAYGVDLRRQLKDEELRRQALMKEFGLDVAKAKADVPGREGRAPAGASASPRPSAARSAASRGGRTRRRTASSAWTARSTGWMWPRSGAWPARLAPAEGPAEGQAEVVAEAVEVALAVVEAGATRASALWSPHPRSGARTSPAGTSLCAIPAARPTTRCCAGPARST